MQTTIEPTTQLPRHSRDARAGWAALLVLCVGMLMIVLDAAVVNVALPAIQRDLGFSQSSLAWVVNAYLIAFGGLLLLAGRLGDLVSRRGVFLVGVGVFTAASLVCGLALALVAQVQADGAYLSGVLPSMLLLGTGVGVSIPALATLAMSGATEGDAGLASGLINTTTQVGAALGLAVLATLWATRSGHLLARGQATAEALTGGYRMAFLIAAGLVVAAIAIALAVLRPEAEAEPESRRSTAAGRPQRPLPWVTVKPPRRPAPGRAGSWRRGSRHTAERHSLRGRPARLRKPATPTAGTVHVAAGLWPGGEFLVERLALDAAGEVQATEARRVRHEKGAVVGPGLPNAQGAADK
jgi:MFS family permease